MLLHGYFADLVTVFILGKDIPLLVDAGIRDVAGNRFGMLASSGVVLEFDTCGVFKPVAVYDRKVEFWHRPSRLR